MKITPLAADSMGSRSMAVFVETRDGRILIDPGASVAPLRYGLSPHPVEEWQLQKHLDRLRLFTESATAVVITSIHRDHFAPDHPEWMKNKILFMKNPNRETTPDERKTAFHYLKNVKSLAREIHFADERSFKFGNTELVFSPACSNGQEYFIQLMVRSEEKALLFSSNVQGFGSDEAASFMLGFKAETVYLDGPVTYTQKYRSSPDAMASLLERMRKVALGTGAHHVILDHHLMRDVDWEKHVRPFLRFGSEKGIQILTAAAFRGDAPAFLEARRGQLYQNQPQALPPP
jgi:uncharacterized protein